MTRPHPTPPETSADSTQRDRESSEFSQLDEGSREIVYLINRVRSATPEVMSDVFDFEGDADGFGGEKSKTGHEEFDTTAARVVDSSLADELPVIIGRFKIQEQLGAGGNGIVFRAIDSRLKRTVALKVPRAEALVTKRLRERFIREAEAAAALDHPNVVPVYEAGAVGAVSYIAYGYCEGESLLEWLQRRGKPADPRDAACIVAAVADGLQHAHSRGVLHRDIKPSNVMIAGAAADGSDFADRIKITDFGMARVEADDIEATRTGTILGTPAYMAPEQSRGEKTSVGPTADVYALGALLYELLTGQAPFDGDNVIDILQDVRSKVPPPPSKLQRGVPRDLDVLALRCLDKEPHCRLPSAGFLADELRRFLNGKSILSRPDAWPTRVMKWSRRHPAIATMTALLTCAIVVGVVAVIWQWRRAERGWEQAASARQTESILREQAEADRYAFGINLAQNEIRAGRFGGALELLTEFDPQRRHLEWNHLVGEASRATRAWVDFKLQPNGISLSANGERMLVSEGILGVQDEGRWTMWNTETGALIRQSKEKCGRLFCANFSPDDRFFATASIRNLTEQNRLHSIAVWDSETGERIWTAGEQRVGFDCAFSIDGETLVSGGADGVVRLWSAKDGTLLERFSGHTDNVFDVEFHPTLPVIASASRDGTVRLWNVENGESLQTLEICGDARCVAFSADGRWLAAGGYEGRVVTFDLENEFAESFRMTLPDVNAIFDVAFNAAGSELTTAGSDGTVRTLDSTGQLVHSFRHAEGNTYRIGLDEPRERIFCVSSASKTVSIWPIQANSNVIRYVQECDARDMEFSPDGSHVAIVGKYNRSFAASRDYSLKLIDVDSWRVTERLEGHSGWPLCVSYSWEGDRIVTGGEDKTARIWSAKNARQLAELPHQAVVLACCFSADGKQVLTFDTDSLLSVWDGFNAELAESRKISFERPTIAKLCVESDLLLVANEERWQLFSLGQAKMLSQGEASRIRTAAIDPTGTWIAVGSDSDIYGWRVDSDDPKTRDADRILTGHGQLVTDLTFTRDGRRLLSSSHDSTVKVWSLDTKQGLLTLGSSEDQIPWLSAVAVDNNNQRIAGSRVHTWFWSATPKNLNHLEIDVTPESPETRDP